MQDGLTPAAFEQTLDSAFTLPQQGLELRLIEIGRLPATAVRSEPFSLLFLGPVQPLLPQDIYHMEHPSMGEADIFIVPISADAAGVRYEAVFN